MTLPPRFQAMQERCDAAEATDVTATSQAYKQAFEDMVAHSRTDVPDLLWSLGVALEELGKVRAGRTASDFVPGESQTSWMMRRIDEAIALIERGRDAT